VTPLRNEDGSIRGYLKIGQDVSERRNAQEALEVSERRMRSLATGIPQLVFRSYGTGERIWGSPQWIAYTGLSFEESLGFGWLEAVHPDDRGATMAAWQGVEERGGYYIEHRIRDARTGGWCWHQTRAAPLRDDEGKVLEWLGSSTEVEEMRRLQRHQQTLLGELQHRVRNTLGVVRSIARRTAELSDSKDDLADHLQGRLAAFARVQAAVTRTAMGGVDLAVLIEDELLAHAARESETVTIDGPDVNLKPRPAESLSLAIHELATNAVKYGALSRAGGTLSVRWTVEQRDGTALLRLGWEEGGMDLPPEKPSRRGFGMELLERSLPYELDAVTRAEFRPTGFIFTMELPLATLGAE
jgi:PAS domain S-box-containing protein